MAFLYKPSMMPSNSTIVNGPLSMVRRPTSRVMALL